MSSDEAVVAVVAELVEASLFLQALPVSILEKKQAEPSKIDTA
ncbi:MAG TPA: hypothetical protein VFC92_09950 [Bacteroidales bacterium]|nr:hypothetical protein [Bacteroidales bacterium]